MLFNNVHKFQYRKSAGDKTSALYCGEENMSKMVDIISIQNQILYIFKENSAGYNINSK